MPRNAGDSYGLKRFEGNRPLLEQLTADRLNAIMDACEMNKVSFGKGVTGRRLPGGTILNVKASATPSVGANEDPFAVTIRKTPATGTPPVWDGTYQFSVHWNSSLLKNLILNNTQSITGLANAPAPTGDGNLNWAPFTLGNDLVYLRILLDGAGKPTDAHIWNWAQGNFAGESGSWAPGDKPGEYGSGTGPFECQTQYDGAGNAYYPQYIIRVPILMSITAVGTPFPVSNIQLLKSNLALEGDIYSDAVNFSSGLTPQTVAITKAVPYFGPYIST